MNYLESIKKDVVEINRDYFENADEVILKDIEALDWNTVVNPHLFNLKSLMLTPEKTVVDVTNVGDVKTGDLSIDDDSHSYFANGTPSHNTVNPPNDYPFEKFKDLYMNAWKKGLRSL